MADTIITNTPPPKGEDSGSAGWAVAVIILLIVIVGGFVLYQKGFFTKAAPESSGDTNINVTIPNPDSPAPKTDTQP